MRTQTDCRNPMLIAAETHKSNPIRTTLKQCSRRRRKWCVKGNCTETVTPTTNLAPTSGRRDYNATVQLNMVGTCERCGGENLFISAKAKVAVILEGLRLLFRLGANIAKLLLLFLFRYLDCNLFKRHTHTNTYKHTHKYCHAHVHKAMQYWL